MNKSASAALFLIIVVFFVKPKLAEYTAAVVEFYPEQDIKLSPEERLKRNVDGYLKILEDIEKDKHILDIIVFPESTLATRAVINYHTDYVPLAVEINDNQSLCKTQNETFLTRLACAAQQYKTYMVINLYEKEHCKQLSKCSQDGWTLYNTNVVLDRTGSVISKYRKYNLFGELFMNQTESADISIFDTDFGVKFGTFICFDILFNEPTLDLIRKYNVTNIVYPTMWFSELPFLTGLQTQLQWAYAVNATFLASGANDPERGSGGTGIYRGTEGPLVYEILGNTQSKGFVSKMSQQKPSIEDTVEEIDKKAKQMDGFYFKIDDLLSYTSKTIEFEEKEVNTSFCHNNICCHFEISLKWNNTIEKENRYVYHMVAYDGVRSFSGVYNGGVEICGVIACMDETLNSCSKRFPNYDNVYWPTTFEHIQIKAQFEIDEKRIQHPNSLLSNIKPLSVDAINWTAIQVDTKIERIYTLLKPQSRLMTFAIYGRDFNRDHPNSSNTNTLKFTCLVVLIALNIYL